MAQLWPILLLAGGLALIIAGMLLLSRSLHRLQRAGAFSGLYWSSFRRYAGYRLRSLRSVGGGVVGILMVAGGLAALYFGMVAFYATRLGSVSG